LNKIPLFIICIILLPSTSIGQKIKSIKEIIYRAEKKHGEYIPGKISWDDWWGHPINFMKVFDKDSNIIELREYYQPKKKKDTIYPYSFSRMEYSDKKPIGKITGYKEPTGDSGVNGYILFKYGANDYFEMTYLAKDKTTLQRRVVKKRSDSSKNVDYTEIYNRHNRLFERYITVNDTVNHIEYFNCYDSLNNLLESNKTLFVKEKNGNIWVYKYMFYNRLGTKNIYPLAKKALSDSTETYIRSDGKIITQHRLGGTIPLIQDYTYNKNNEVLTFRNRAKDSLTQFPRDWPDPPMYVKYLYKYDQYGNWVEKEEVDMKKDIPYFIIKREIVYY
jgi:hypothetical protein